MSVQPLIAAAQITLLLATVGYCGARMRWRPHFLFQAAAQVAVFASVVIVGLLLAMQLSSHAVLLRTLFGRLTRPIRDLADEFLFFL
jgi:hypothetical protein